MATSTNLNITDEQVNYGIEIGDKIMENKRNAGYKDRGGHAKKEPTKSNHMGFIGETIVADYLGCERPKVIEDELDDGYDLKKAGQEIEVKSTETPYLILFPKDFERKTPDMYSVVRMDFDGVVGGGVREVEYFSISREEVEEGYEMRNFGYGPRVVYDLRE